jgi:hypothetical protein
MQTSVNVNVNLLYFVEVFTEWEIFRAKDVKKLKHILCLIICFGNPYVYEII